MLWATLAAYGGLMVATLFKRRAQDRSFLPLMGLIVSSFTSQTLLMLRMTNTILEHPWLHTLTVPTTLCSLWLAYLFGESYTLQNRVRWRNGIWGPLAGLIFYFASQVHFRWSPEGFDPTYGLAHTPWNFARITLVLSYAGWTLVRFRKHIRVFEQFAKLQYSNLIPLRLPLLKVLWTSLIVTTAILAFDFATGPDIALWKLRPGVTLITLTIFSVHVIKFSVWLESQVPEASEPSSESAQETLAPAPSFQVEASEAQKIADKIRAAFEKDHAHLNPTLRLNDLAETIGVKPYKVSWVLNQVLHQGFYDLVNGYRIREAERILQSSQYDHLNLLGVAQESGFNSKSVFNDTFKRIKGMTPSEFKASISRSRPD